MSLTGESLETLELRYLNKIWDILLKYLPEILDRFYSRIKLHSFWEKQFAGGEEIKRLSDLSVGAERVFHTIFAKNTDWSPSSIPVGSNLFYESDEVFLNVDIKSVYVENSWDYLGVAEVGERQTSYPMQNTWGASTKFFPQLPSYYEANNARKPSLTYIMQIIHLDIDRILEGKYDPNAIAFVLLAVPNGLLYEKYGEKIIEEPKTYHQKDGVRYRPANFRYAYHNCPWFVELKQKGIEQFRVRVAFNKNYLGKEFLTKYKFNEKLIVKMLPEKITLMSSDIIKKISSIFERTHDKTIVTDYDFK
jgi:hypothetical protein